MASFPFDNSHARLSSHTPSVPSPRTVQNPPVTPHPAPRFADFQFRTIGQQPELLKRISAPNPDTHYDNNFDQLSPSPLSPEKSIQTLPLPESDSAKRPSLQDRLSLLESPAAEKDDAVDVTMENAPEIRPAVDTGSTQTIGVLPMATSKTQAHRRHADSSPSERPPAISRTAFLQNHTLGKEPKLSQDPARQDQAIRTTTERDATSASDKLRLTIVTSSSGIKARLSPPLAQTPTRASGTSGVSTPFSSRKEVHSLTALRTIQSRLSSSLSNFNPISTANALAAAQSAKDQCTEILATAHRAHTLAQQASLLAQDSMVAAQECLNVAATIQNRADLALSAVEKIRSGQGTSSGGEWEYNATVKALKDDLYKLTEWVRQWDAYDSNPLHQLEEDKIEECEERFQLERESYKSSANKQSHDLNTHSGLSGLQISIHEAGAMTVEDEADAATQAWNQHREQSAERKRLAEDELRKHLEADIELERQRLQAQSELDAREAELEKTRAERLKAEEEERSRQEKEALELQRQQQELEIARFLRSQKQARDDLAKVAAEEKKKAQVAEAEKEAHWIAEHEQKRREFHEKEILKRQGMEKAKTEGEAKRREKMTLERMKRLTVEAQQPPVSSDTVANILDKAKEKQSIATLTTDNHTPPSQYALLPSTPAHQASALSNPSHAEFGNVLSKKTLLTNSPRTSKQQKRTLSGSIKPHETSDSINLISSILSIPKSSSTFMQEGAKSHELIPSMPSSIDKLLTSDNSTLGMSSSYIHEVDRKSGDSVCNTGPLKSPSSPLPLTLTEENSSLPVTMPPVHIPNFPSTSSNDFEDIHAEINNHSECRDAGNLFVVPPSRVLPVSAEAQHANLRPFMDANGISYGLGASDVDEQRPFPSNTNQPSVTTEKSRRKPLSSSQMNGVQMCRTSSASKPGPVKKPKLEPLDDVPILSMPSPPAATIDDALPTCTDFPVKPKPKLPDFRQLKPSMTALETPLSSKELPPLPQTMPPAGSFAQPPGPAVSQLDSSSLANSSIVSKEKVRPAAVRRNVPPLASNEQIPILADTINQSFRVNDLHLSVSPRMGPDAALTDGWTRPIPMVDDLMAKRPQKQLPQKALGRFSPPLRVPLVSSQNRLLPRRLLSRTNNHYSPPRRITDSLPSHNDYSRDRRRSGSVEYTREISPEYNEDHRSLSPDVPITGRKRYRDDDSVVAPRPRRYRYDGQPLRQDDYVQPSTSSYQQLDVDRSCMTNYGGSPSPKPRLTPLALRLESEKPSWNSQGGTSYRPIYNSSNSYAYDPQSHNNKNHRYSAPHSQSIPQGSSCNGDASNKFNQQRKLVRNDITDDTRLPLLSRFTDSTEQTLSSFNNYHGSTRPRLLRGPRGGGSQALEHRLSKPKSVSLINRLEDAN